MLRIQSLAKITFEIDENFTPVLQSQSRKPDPKTSVTSLDKRDRQSLFQWTGPKSRPRPRRPRFSFFSIQLSKNRRSIPSQSHQKQQKQPEPNQALFSPAPSGNLRASSSAARSAAALVRWPGYRPKVSGRQQRCDTFLKKSSKKCVCLSFTTSESRISGHFRAQTAQTGPIALRLSQSAPLERSVEPV